jgi:hypothetical protein
VVGARRWDLTVWRPSVDRVLYENLPAIRRLLKRIQVECDQVVKEVAFDLTAEDVDFAAKDV